MRRFGGAAPSPPSQRFALPRLLLALPRLFFARVQVLLLAFPSADALEVWRAYLQRCSTGGGAAAAAAAAGSAGAGVGAESSDFCGWLLKAAPGWKTFQNRFIVLDAEKCALRYFEIGPTVSVGKRRARGAEHWWEEGLRIPPPLLSCARVRVFFSPPPPL